MSLTHPPGLHDLISTVAAPAFALYPQDGQLGAQSVLDGDTSPGSAQGVYVEDRRILSVAVVSIPGSTLIPLRSESLGADTARFVYLAELADGRGSVMLERRVVITASGAREELRLELSGCPSTQISVRLRLAADLADLATVRSGRPPRVPAPHASLDSLQWPAADGTTARVQATPLPQRVDPGEITWTVPLERGQVSVLSVDIFVCGDPTPPVVARAVAEPWVRPRVTGRADLVATIDQSLADLGGLLLADPEDRRDHFVGAGSPWYLTLFGRDSLWTARMLLPLGTDLAAGTLRALARRQGRRSDRSSAEQPGKILHELRRKATDVPSGRTDAPLHLPPLYFGTVDATPLWLILLHDAWRWGLPEAEVADLLDAAEAALAWMRDYGTGSSGFLEYDNRGGMGLANQGWKDSGDALRFADGRVAVAGPIALCEAQGYAYQAAVGAADLLDAFGRKGGAEWRDWAESLAHRFRTQFWIDGSPGRIPAIALDGSGRPADTLTSNIGHLLGTGLLTPAESATIARALSGPDMDAGVGLRTLSADAVAFDPLSYHCGSVWSHDTAIVARGLAGDGHQDAAAALIAGLLRVAPRFDHRLPELHSGHALPDGEGPIPYPASCRPQAWSAAAAIHLLSTLIGIQPDVPNGRLALQPLRNSPFGPLSVSGLRVAGQRLDLAVAVDGHLKVTRLPSGLTLA